MSTPSPPRSASSRGVLLFEAVLSAVVLTVGFVGVARALSHQLHSLRAAQERDLLLGLAESTLIEIEARIQKDLAPVEIEDVRFEPPYEAYEWTLDVQFRDDDLVWDVPVVRASLLIKPADNPQPRVMLRTVWPLAWVPEEWL